MPAWTIADAMSALDPYFDEVDRICRGGLATYRRYAAEFLVEHDARAAASCVYSHMVAQAERELTPKSGVVFKDIKGLKVWIVGEIATIRFKKMDEDGRARNYPTEQAQRFDRQLPLPGIPLPPLNLVVGYLPDPTGTEVVRVQVARPMGKSIDWCAAIAPVQERTAGGARWQDVTRQVRGL